MLNLHIVFLVFCHGANSPTHGQAKLGSIYHFGGRKCASVCHVSSLLLPKYQEKRGTISTIDQKTWMIPAEQKVLITPSNPNKRTTRKTSQVEVPRREFTVSE